MTKRSTRAVAVKGSRRAAKVKRSVAARQPAAVKRSKRPKQMNGAKPANGRDPAGEHRKTFKPSRKITAATLGSAIAGLVLVVVNAVAHKNGSNAVPTEMASMVTVVATFAAGWLIPPGAREAINETERGHRMAVA
jgi:hypothetical protein